MTQWATFVGITGVVLALLLVLSYLTESSFDTTGHETEAGTETETETGSVPAETSPAETPPTPDSDVLEKGTEAQLTDSHPTESEPQRHDGARGGDIDPSNLSSGVLLANVALSQGVFALVLIGAAIYTAIPASALGIEFSRAYLETGLLIGAIAGIVLYVANEIGAAVATRAGFTHDEGLRELLAPESARGWVVLLVGVLPIIAVFEELLFRAAVIGVISTHYGVDPWILAVVSSLAFALGHGIQGSVGIIITGTLGFALAAIFIVTGSFLVVVVAHYLINALEFIVHEGLDRDWASGLEASTNDPERDSQG
ncbi:CPBP family intramembrane metalloprotease [Natronolimnobius sp. AArcel1]|uniref:CPBP family intramembrane glutamic endopeptidase n=1 Tax=Natronolimnobius sp. AArcel1 TaxID=1679093 RepID=UPI0013EB5C8E|nr:type II CAAX endopeptidase family protein [Natronolimnobius sp. AArcel1]NGM69689.1 CPBP family intramembrane metalloprotease [Natronolimnobius sp. AArcel1]